MITSSGWPSLLCMAIVFVGWFGPLIGAVETSSVYKVLRSSDNMGGSCDDRLTQVNNMAEEVLALAKASIEAIDVIIRSPTVAERANISSRGKNRERILLLAREIFGAGFTEKSSLGNKVQSLKLEDSGKTQMNKVKERFTGIRDYINNGGDSNWRFACGDSWITNVTTLPTEYFPFKKGARIGEVGGLNAGYHDTEYDYTWFDRGGPTMNPAPPEKPNDSDQDGVARFKIQSTWYYPANKGWSILGPCSGMKHGTTLADAETMQSKRIIYFCPRVWEKVARGTWKADLTQLTGAIPTDGTARLDNYQSPGATLLHEMTHHLFDTDDELGYNFKNVSKGRNQPGAAYQNADNYNYFAAAAYLAQCDWHTGFAREL